MEPIEAAVAQCVGEAAEGHDAAGGGEAFGSRESNYQILLSLTRCDSTYILLNLIHVFFFSFNNNIIQSSLLKFT